MSTGEFVELNKENEHILVCLSSSPSNEKIIRTAAKMARDMRARFTALYVQTGKRERESDKRRLEAHVQFAKESGAEIVMTHGENVPVQIAEYAHLSKTAWSGLCRKAYDERQFINIIYICSLYVDRSIHPETSIYRYKHRYNLYFGCFINVNPYRWIFIQHWRFCLKCIFVLLFPYGTKNVISDVCSWISDNFCDHVNIFCHYWNTCSKIKNTCKAFSTICISYTDFI